MIPCLICGGASTSGHLCSAHVRALAAPAGITPEQLLCRDGGPPLAWLVDPFGRALPLAGSGIVGRSLEQCALAILHPSVSARHARLARGDGRLWVEDLGSTNGTTVDGAPVQRGPVAEGARLTLGEVSVYVTTRPLDDAALATFVTAPSGGRKGQCMHMRGAGEHLLLVEQGEAGAIVEDGVERLSLSPLERCLLQALAERRIAASTADEAYVPAAELAEALPFGARRADGENVRELVRRVRKKLADAGLPSLIDTKPRAGYRLAFQALWAPRS